MDADDLSDLPLPPRIEFAIRPTAEYAAMRPRPEFAAMRPIPAPRQQFPHPLSMPRPEFPHPLSMPGPRFLSPTPSAAPFPREYPAPAYNFAHGIPPRPLMGNVLIEGLDGPRVELVNDPNVFRQIATMMGLDQRSDEGSTTTTTDNETDEDEGTDRDAAAVTTVNGCSQPATKRTRRTSDTTAPGVNNRDEGDAERPADSGNIDAATDSGLQRNRADVLPDLPRRSEPLVDRAGRLTDFTVQEHTFLAWAKTMSTFTAKRQAKIKMKINKIMSEAEFEDLDDEFFAGKSYVTYSNCIICHVHSSFWRAPKGCLNGLTFSPS